MSAGQQGSTLYRVLSASLRKVGKSYQPDPELPAQLIVSVFRTRVAWLARGVVRFQGQVFVAPSVRVRGRGHITLGRGCTLERDVVVDGYARRGVTIGARTRIGAYTVISCTSHLSLLGEGFCIGEDSGIGEFGYIGAAGGVTIGKHVIMGQYVSFHSQEHEFGDVSSPISSQGSSEKGITVGDDVWVGARVTFLDGSEVGHGSVVAAGAVVRGTFPPYSVIAGVPARLIRQRDAEEGA